MHHTTDWAAPKRGENLLFVLTRHRLVCSSISSSECAAVQVQNIYSVSPAKLTVMSQTRNHSYNKDKHRHTTHWGWKEMLSRLQGMLEVQGWTVDLISLKESCGDYNRGLIGSVLPGVGMWGAKGDQSRGWAVMARSDAANWRKALQAPGGCTTLPVLAQIWLFQWKCAF